jgi:TRAP-type transport system periplasmic protein
VTPHFTALGFTFGYSAVTVNLSAWNKLPEDLKNVLLNASKEIEAKQENRARSVDESARAELVKHGVKVNEIAPAFRQECLALSEPLWANWVKRAGPEGQPLIDEVRKMVKK